MDDPQQLITDCFFQVHALTLLLWKGWHNDSFINIPVWK